LSVFPHDIKLGIQVFHDDDESLKRIYFMVKKSKVKVTSHKNQWRRNHGWRRGSLHLNVNFGGNLSRLH